MMVCLLVAQDKSIVKYYLAGDNPQTVFNDEISESVAKNRSHFKVTYSSNGDIIGIQYIAVEKRDITPSITETIQFGSPSSRDSIPPFIPLTPDQQAEMNPKNPVVQNAFFWNRWKYKTKQQEVIDISEEIMDDVVDSVEDTVSGDTLALEPARVDTFLMEDTRPKEIIAILREEAPELTSDSVTIKERKRQRISTSKSTRPRYFRHWDPLRSTLRVPVLPEDALLDFYKAAYDGSGVLASVTYFESPDNPIKTTTFIRDSLGLYTTYKETYHLRTSLVETDPHKYVPDVSDLRPGWSAVFTMDGGHRVIKRLGVYDKVGVYMYAYSFAYSTGKSLKNSAYEHAITAYYFTAEDSLIGWHRLWYKEKKNLSYIEYFDKDDQLLHVKEFDYNPQQKELLITLRNPKGDILDRRLKPVF